MVNKKYTIKEISKWFIERKLYENDENLTYNKLQKLLFYSKAFGFVLANDNIMVESALLTENGVEFEDVLAFESDEKLEDVLNLLKDEKSIADKEVGAVLEYVFEKFDEFSEEELSINSSKELANLNIKAGEIIKDEEIKKLYRELYVSDNPQNDYNLTREDIIDGISFVIYKKYDKAFKVLGQ